MKPTLQELQRCAVLCEFAYQHELAGAHDLAEGLGFSLAGFESKETDTQGLVVWNDDEVFVVFRGTSSLADCLTDVKVRREFGTHRGFRAAYLSIIDQLDRLLEQHEWKGKQVTFTGHSLGGALAMVAMDRYPRSPFARYQCITFGQPRVYGTLAASVINEHRGPDIWRVVHDTDAITRLPGVLMGYRHAGNELFIDCWGRLNENPSLAYKLLSDVCSFFLDLEERRLGVASDHFISRYLTAIENLISREALAVGNNTPLSNDASPVRPPQLSAEGDPQ